ncbi:1-acyl-sn-glycerol-3-phosphate acyltransferase [Brevibacillus fluminis]|uniref:1-acyl-sn-glycerol-3-phosphate acyltransferase n=1 Tax=Brevibacillus fluminis TaxID=511487 RepID=A0A3M8D1P4_9BACL|nr:lysophospholipid acyltransferase family protein [Brevibacillus fluminis]RNB81609.1 1-acyl-sn-glycerol-3-phosphate acyltransferase [Brevibacillus fluminis]
MSYYTFFRGICRLLIATCFRWRVIGRENVPKTGAVILCCNHIGNIDPPLLGSGIERQVRFMAKEELFHVPVLSFLLKKFGTFPVKRGAGDRNAIRTTLKILEDGEILGIFPEGTRSKNGELGRAQSGSAMFALKSKAEVVPVAIIGPWRFLKPITIIYGKPIDMTAIREKKVDSESMREATDLIMQHIKELIDAHKAK